MSAKKAKQSPVTRFEFFSNAKDETVKLLGEDVTVAAREFSTGSMGWGNNEKCIVMVGGKKVMASRNISIVLIDSAVAIPMNATEEQQLKDKLAK